MTREEAFEIHPQSASCYWLVLVGWILFAVVYFFIHPHNPPRDRWVQPITLACMFLSAYQAAARLVFPMWSAELTVSLRKNDVICAVGALVVPTAVAVIILGTVRGVHSEARMLGNILLLANFAVSDALGRQYPSERRRPFSPSGMPPMWKSYLKPIQSDHWGED